MVGMDTKRIEEILSFWFGEIKSDEDFPVEKAKMWFQEGQKSDGFIRETFGQDLEAAIQGKYESWADEPRGLLALIILLDQFSRNIYRDQPQSFAQDKQAIELSLKGIAKGRDKKLRPVERVFMYMPLMHSESREVQNKCVEMFSKLADQAPAAIEVPLRNNLDFAVRHSKIIEKFGRFPYRNAVLGRTSTPEEEAYLSSAKESWF